MALGDSHSGSHWLSLPLSGILSALGSLAYSRLSALSAAATLTHSFPLWCGSSFPKRERLRALLQGRISAHSISHWLHLFFPALSFNRCFTTSAYGYGCRIREGKTTLRSRVDADSIFHPPPSLPPLNCNCSQWTYQSGEWGELGAEKWRCRFTLTLTGLVRLLLFLFFFIELLFQLHRLNRI